LYRQKHLLAIPQAQAVHRQAKEILYGVYAEQAEFLSSVRR